MYKGQLMISQHKTLSLTSLKLNPDPLQNTLNFIFSDCVTQANPEEMLTEKTAQHLLLLNKNLCNLTPNHVAIALHSLSKNSTETPSCLEKQIASLLFLYQLTKNNPHLNPQIKTYIFSLIAPPLTILTYLQTATYMPEDQWPTHDKQAYYNQAFYQKTHARIQALRSSPSPWWFNPEITATFSLQGQLNTFPLQTMLCHLVSAKQLDKTIQLTHYSETLAGQIMQFSEPCNSPIKACFYLLTQPPFLFHQNFPVLKETQYRDEPQIIRFGSLKNPQTVHLAQATAKNTCLDAAYKKEVQTLERELTIKGKKKKGLTPTPPIVLAKRIATLLWYIPTLPKSLHAALTKNKNVYSHLLQHLDSEALPYLLPETVLELISILPDSSRKHLNTWIESHDHHKHEIARHIFTQWPIPLTSSQMATFFTKWLNRYEDLPEWEPLDAFWNNYFQQPIADREFETLQRMLDANDTLAQQFSCRKLAQHQKLADPKLTEKNHEHIISALAANISEHLSEEPEIKTSCQTYFALWDMMITSLTAYYKANPRVKQKDIEKLTDTVHQSFHMIPKTQKANLSKQQVLETIAYAALCAFLNKNTRVSETLNWLTQQNTTGLDTLPESAFGELTVCARALATEGSEESCSRSLETFLPYFETKIDVHFFSPLARIIIATISERTDCERIIKHPPLLLHLLSYLKKGALYWFNQSEQHNPSQITAHADEFHLDLENYLSLQTQLPQDTCENSPLDTKTILGEMMTDWTRFSNVARMCVYKSLTSTFTGLCLHTHRLPIHPEIIPPSFRADLKEIVERFPEKSTDPILVFPPLLDAIPKTTELQHELFAQFCTTILTVFRGKTDSICESALRQSEWKTRSVLIESYTYTCLTAAKGLSTHKAHIPSLTDETLIHVAQNSLYCFAILRFINRDGKKIPTRESLIHNNMLADLMSSLSNAVDPTVHSHLLKTNIQTLVSGLTRFPFFDTQNLEFIEGLISSFFSEQGYTDPAAFTALFHALLHGLIKSYLFKGSFLFTNGDFIQRKQTTTTFKVHLDNPPAHGLAHIWKSELSELFSHYVVLFGHYATHKNTSEFSARLRANLCETLNTLLPPESRLRSLFLQTALQTLTALQSQQ